MCQDMLGEGKMKKNSVRTLTISALLIGMGVIIPMVMPKIMIPPASFTLASHVPLFIALFFSPGVAIAVALGTTFGFFLSSSICRYWGMVLAKKSTNRFERRSSDISKLAFSKF